MNVVEGAMQAIIDSLFEEQKDEQIKAIECQIIAGGQTINGAVKPQTEEQRTLGVVEMISIAGNPQTRERVQVRSFILVTQISAILVLTQQQIEIPILDTQRLFRGGKP